MHPLGLFLVALQSMHTLAVPLPLAPARTETGGLHRRSEGDFRYPNLPKAHAMFLERGWWHLDGTIDYANYPWDQHGHLKAELLQEAQDCLEEQIDANVAEPKNEGRRWSYHPAHQVWWRQRSASSGWSLAFAIDICQEFAGGEPTVTNAMRGKLQRLSDQFGEMWEPPDNLEYERREWEHDMKVYAAKVAQALEKYGTKPRRQSTWTKWSQAARAGAGGGGDGASRANDEAPSVADGGPRAFSHAAAHPALDQTHVLRPPSAHHLLPPAVARAVQAQLGTRATQQPKGSLPSFASVGAYGEGKKQVVGRESRPLSAAQPAPSFFSTLARQARGSVRRVESTAASVWRAAQHSLSSHAKAAPGWSPLGLGVGFGGGGGRAVAPPLRPRPVVPEFY
ncbi:MAG: hypothetical protein M1826_006866 [Phylliscum demangeonii]|nr:MAG: hypothetical protein M1826_006866 [Phylliscum demangeonii]